MRKSLFNGKGSTGFKLKQHYESVALTVELWAQNNNKIIKGKFFNQLPIRIYFI